MSDDELQRRLREIPAPRAGLDVDAAIAGAKRKRRPKTIALSSAATVAGVLIVAPLVVPGLSPLRPTSSEVSMDSGAAPESAEAPAAEPEFQEGSGTDAVEDSDAEDAGSGDTGASGGSDSTGDSGAAGDDAQAACGAVRAGDVGLALRFLDDPGEGSAELEIANAANTRLSVQVLGTGSAALTADRELLAAGTTAVSELSSERAPGETMRVAVELVPRATCAADGTEPDASAIAGIAPVATVLVTREGQDEATAVVVVGEPFDVR